MTQVMGNLSKCLVGCNVYVSAGSRSSSRQVLLNLLENTQKHCQWKNKSSQEEASSQQEKKKVALVHAFADGPYDRSSFHIAGSPGLVSQVASQLATEAVQTLSALQNAPPEPTDIAETAHPTVGLVDHVSILPLAYNNQVLSFEEWRRHCPLEDVAVVNTLATTVVSSETVPSGWVAREVGQALEKAGVNVFLYGHAHEQNIPLATVRRERTNFFKAQPLLEEKNRGQATVGAPEHFVENYNVRLEPHCSRKIALSLTKYLRERDGGLKFVEALTLPYSNHRFEAACNLLSPEVVAANDVDARVKEWTQTHGNLVEKSYRVGTTAAQCMDALDQTATSAKEEEHNKVVRARFESYFL